MKPEKKPFVVEIKNRRRLSRKEHSIWGKIDLKAADDHVAAAYAAGSHGPAISMRPSEAAADHSPNDISA
jgi:hypothetical protein